MAATHVQVVACSCPCRWRRGGRGGTPQQPGQGAGGWRHLVGALSRVRPRVVRQLTPLGGQALRFGCRPPYWRTKWCGRPLTSRLRAPRGRDYMAMLDIVIYMGESRRLGLECRERKIVNFVTRDLKNNKNNSVSKKNHSGESFLIK